MSQHVAIQLKGIKDAKPKTVTSRKIRSPQSGLIFCEVEQAKRGSLTQSAHYD